MKRLAVYVHYDSKGMVRDYVLHCLKGLKDVVDEILVVVNGTLTAEGLKRLEGAKVDVLVRENRGFDFQGWKAGLEHYGYDRLADYDELLLTNNSYYGPIYPFSEMWGEMDTRACDFWGITWHPEISGRDLKRWKGVDFHAHIQSYWLVFRKQLLQAEAFRAFWQDLGDTEGAKKAIRQGELQLTAYFEKAGFKPASYLDPALTSALCYDPFVYSDRMVMEQRCPILKRKFFSTVKPSLTAMRDSLAVRKVFDWLKEEGHYDTDAIWDDLLANNSLSTLNDHLCLNHIFPSGSAEVLPTPPMRAALIMYIYYPELIDFMLQYAASVPETMDIMLVAASQNVAEECEKAFAALPNKLEVRTQPNRGRDQAALLVTCADIIGRYEYICFMHSKRTPQSLAVGEAFRQHCFTSLLHNRAYVQHILRAFAENPRLGLLTPPPPTSFSMQSLIGWEWTCNAIAARDFLRDEMQVDMGLDPHVMAPFGGMLWARSDALKSLLARGWNYEDFPEEPFPATDGLLPHVLERIFPLLAQQDGYYSAWAAPDFYAEVLAKDLHYLLIKQKEASVYSPKHLARRRAKYKLLSCLAFGKRRAKYKEKAELAEMYLETIRITR